MTIALRHVFSKHAGVSKSYGVVDAAKVAQGHRFILLAFDQSIHIDTILARNLSLYTLPMADGVKLKAECFGFCQNITALMKLFHPTVPVFPYTLKKHYLLHIAKVAEYMNPSLASCAEGEDLMKVLC